MDDPTGSRNQEAVYYVRGSWIGEAMVDFDTPQLDAAIDYVIRQGAENRGQTVYYTQVFEAARLPQPQDLTKGEVSDFMEQFHHRLTERGLPSLDALVVHVAGDRPGVPGPGYFRVNRQVDPLDDSATDESIVRAMQLWEEQKQECKTWGREHRRARRRDV